MHASDNFDNDIQALLCTHCGLNWQQQHHIWEPKNEWRQHSTSRSGHHKLIRSGEAQSAQCGRNSRISFSALLKVCSATECSVWMSRSLRRRRMSNTLGIVYTAVPECRYSGRFEHFEFGPVPVYTLWPRPQWFNWSAVVDQMDPKMNQGFEDKCWGTAFPWIYDSRFLGW